MLSDDSVEVSDSLLNLVEIHLSLRTSFSCAFIRPSLSTKLIPVEVSRAQQSIFDGTLNFAVVRLVNGQGLEERTNWNFYRSKLITTKISLRFMVSFVHASLT